MESGECVAQVSPDYAALHPGYIQYLRNKLREIKPKAIKSSRALYLFLCCHSLNLNDY